MTTGISPKPKTACQSISSGTTRSVSINPWSTTPPSRFTPAGSPWVRRLRETSGAPTPKTKTSENHFREHVQGEQESFYEIFTPKNHPRIITLSESIFCLDNGEHFNQSLQQVARENQQPGRTSLPDGEHAHQCQQVDHPGSDERHQGQVGILLQWFRCVTARSSKGGTGLHLTTRPIF